MSASLKSSVLENQMLKKSLPIDILVHLESIGDQFFHEGEFAGTRGQSRRLEGFQLSFHPPQDITWIPFFERFKHGIHGTSARHGRYSMDVRRTICRHTRSE